MTTLALNRSSRLPKRTPSPVDPHTLDGVLLGLALSGAARTEADLYQQACISLAMLTRAPAPVLIDRGLFSARASILMQAGVDQLMATLASEAVDVAVAQTSLAAIASAYEVFGPRGGEGCFEVASRLALAWGIDEVQLEGILDAVEQQAIDVLDSEAGWLDAMASSEVFEDYEISADGDDVDAVEEELADSLYDGSDAADADDDDDDDDDDADEDDADDDELDEDDGHDDTADDDGYDGEAGEDGGA